MTTHTTTCSCGEPLTMEMERDHNKCADCQRLAARKQSTNSFFERWFNFSPLGPVA